MKIVLTKSHVKAKAQRRKGKLVMVSAYDDKRVKKPRAKAFNVPVNGVGGHETQKVMGYEMVPGVLFLHKPLEKALQHTGWNLSIVNSGVILARNLKLASVNDIKAAIAAVPLDAKLKSFLKQHKFQEQIPDDLKKVAADYRDNIRIAVEDLSAQPIKPRKPKRAAPRPAPRVVKPDPVPKFKKPTVSKGLLKLLEENKITSKKRINNSNINETWRVWLQDDGDAVYKRQSNEDKVRAGVPVGGQTIREVLSYDIADTIGYDFVPETTYRKTDPDANSDPGSIQRWVHDAKTLAEHVPYGTAKQAAAFMRGSEHYATQMVAFDYLMGNTDRHDGNILIDEDGKMWAIDNGLCFSNSDEDYRNYRIDQFWDRKHAVFAVRDKLQVPHELFAEISRNKSKIIGICEKYHKACPKLITTNAIDLLKKRIDRLVGDTDWEEKENWDITWDKHCKDAKLGEAL